MLLVRRLLNLWFVLVFLFSHLLLRLIAHIYLMVFLLLYAYIEWVDFFNWFALLSLFVSSLNLFNLSLPSSNYFIDHSLIFYVCSRCLCSRLKFLSSLLSTWHAAILNQNLIKLRLCSKLLLNDSLSEWILNLVDVYAVGVMPLDFHISYWRI